MIALLKTLYCYFIFCLIVIFSLPVFAASSPAEKSTATPANIVGAVCIIRHENKMIMLSEVITRKIAPPGGYIDPGETAREAAARETWEETGIAVRVEDLLQYRGRAAIFSCVAESPILVSSSRDNTGHLIVASWFSSRFSTETQRVYLADPDKINPGDYRFPGDVALHGEWLAGTPESRGRVYSDLSDQVNSLHRYELRLIQRFQQAVKSMPASYLAAFEGLMSVVNIFGEPVFIALLVIVAAGQYGSRAMLHLVFVLLLSVFITSLLKLGVASPRPFYIMPQLQQINANGYGFPSTHTFVVTILWGICWYRLCRYGSGMLKWLALPFFTALIVGQAVARVWYGVHFISDTVASIVLGLIVVMLVTLWGAAPHLPLGRGIASKWFWLTLAIIIGLTTSFTLSPLHLYLSAIALGIFLGMEILPDGPIAASAHWRGLIMVMVGAGLAAIGCGTEWLASQLTLSLVVLLIRAAGWLLAALWLVAGTSYLHQKLAAGQ